MAASVSDIASRSNFDVVLAVLYGMRYEFFFIGCAVVLFGLGSFTSRRKPKTTPSRDRQPQARSASERTKSAAATTRGRVAKEAESSRGVTELNAAVAGVANVGQLKNADWVLPRLANMGDTERAAPTLVAALDAGLDLSGSISDEACQAMTGILVSLVRAAQADEAVRLMQRLRSRGMTISSGLCSSMVRMCTSKQNFHEAIACSDLYIKDSPPESLDRSVWSCLLFCSIELRSFGRCPVILKHLKDSGTPGVKDYWNMIRYNAAIRDCDAMFALIKEMKENAVEADSVIYNTVLASCVSCSKIEYARGLLDDMDQIGGGVADVITYNTLMKGYAKAGLLDECFRLFEIMQKRGLTPSQVTYGILLDGCINSCQVEKASAVFDMMLENQCPLNTVLYTTLIKGFTREGKIAEAMRVYGQMLNDASVQPDLITFSVLMKANCDAKKLDEAFKLLDTMLSLGLHPDEVIFNNLLAGCAKEANAELADRIYDDMVQSGIKPSNATFSTLVRIYSQCKQLDKCVEILRTEPVKYKIELESRVYSQLIQACIRARQGRRAVEVYEMTLDSITPPPALHNSILAVCTKLNMYDTAADLLSVAAQKRALIDARDAQDVLESARRKGKHALVERLEAALRDLNIATA